ncbi:hypothetical protein ADU59_12705 [Pararhizobium polonicum]|uniref:Uncharacterized protein n=1 Tax=Pararhizobium polonicum TaxID=1612624 RepID=A0A1C7P2C0_9HYPH|nr:hypothetical protein [Pararhizobium polonicum]OBZ95423.1 hypothetical protein ADU59_12705 [Pararhizobium polonicum]
MFSFAKTAAISAIIISASMGVAFAGSHGGSSGSGDHNGDHRDGHHDRFMLGDNDITNDDAQNPAFVVPAFTPVQASGPRLQAILSELRADDQRVNADRARGLLTASESRHLKAEDGQIRREAMWTAERNHGVIPTPRYITLQNQAQRLQTEISRMV